MLHDVSRSNMDKGNANSHEQEESGHDDKELLSSTAGRLFQPEEETGERARERETDRHAARDPMDPRTSRAQAARQLQWNKRQEPSACENVKQRGPGVRRELRVALGNECCVPKRRRIRHAQRVHDRRAHRLHPAKEILHRERAKGRSCQAEQDEQPDEGAKQLTNPGWRRRPQTSGAQPKGPPA
jgi:hypothetical protein